ncbi:putative NAD(P)/FAD-binding protein YdhS [Bradyrhizobium sp. USDA 4524]|uniref:FAD/NAD(P)-binding protein n=1 Tax=unclassified Bradyrhizobium TaxID=2631580 RepID=UPI0020A2176E|nr:MULTISPECIES: FAD/NAD(P)-binding protein [unclassified Bradyrhizobium]MCP1845562.1 putative NAD(P)/FAD-binding protein YdhS [Bradyrhizobium sp. USDA 4538]MCP1907116.1 putative NAD(P)/FAD-binding protein YdhS [Bradyrhizobium sp. USDA 4537]MCP1985591.1 putative NAD(P)/FAD-binding protein YdhS [Bradyrhizobium sp. USDA 4539]
MRDFAKRHAIIIGGGASGVLLAYQLLQNRELGFRVTLIERRLAIGRGPAYHTSNPEHVLNVRAANMSALPEDPEHFWRWLSNRREGPQCPDPYCFVPRRTYGDYLASLVTPFTSSEGGARRLTIVHGQCVDVVEGTAGVTVTLDSSSSHTGDVAVLATGNESPVARFPCDADPWAAPSTSVDGDATVLILGTGLTMVDYLLSLLRGGHRGQIVAMSRRGLLARAHRRTDPARIDESDVPFGASASQLLRWLRVRIEAQMAAGGDWRSVIDALRPHTQRLWQELPLASRRRFLEHARAWWDIHRHRTAPEVEMRLTQVLASGRLSLVAAKITGIEPNASGALVRYRRRGQQDTASLQVGLIVDCTGIVKDPRATDNPVIQCLFEHGLARADALQIGIDIANDCAVINRNGIASRRLFAVGPLTRAAFWEIVAIPDIRNQCAKLAPRLAAVCDLIVVAAPDLPALNGEASPLAADDAGNNAVRISY